MHRIVTFYDLCLTAHGINRTKGYEVDFNVKPRPMTDIANEIINLHKSGDNIVKKGKAGNTVKYYLADAKIEHNRFIMLINRSDPFAPDAVSSDPENKSRVVHKKPPNHGGEYSSHIIIELNPVLGDNYYLCALEAVYGSGLHVTSISSYLKYVIRHLKKQFPDSYMIPHNSKAVDEKNQPIMAHYMHLIELQGHPSEEFEKDIDGGTLSGIELINYSKEGAIWDDQGAIIERKRSVELRPQQDKLGQISAAIRQVRNKVTKAGQEYKHIRLRFKTENGEPKDATISSDTGKLVDSDKYVKRHHIKAELVNTTSLDAISKSIVTEVVELMG